jgi:putative ABC transport system permease protein
VTLAALAVILAYDRKIAAIFIVAAAAVFVTLRLVAMLIMWTARRIPRPRYALLRLVLANIHRPGALTPSVVLSLGSASRCWSPCSRSTAICATSSSHRYPTRHPSVFFVDIQDADAARFDAFARKARRTRATSACRCCADASSAQTACAPRI